MNGYLMDTNHVTAWERDHPGILGKLTSLPKGTLIAPSAVAIGEIWAGHEMTSGDAARRHQVKHFLNLNLNAFTIAITDRTAPYYGDLLGRIWRFRPPPPGRSTDQHLVDLGTHINDAWIVASAWEHGLVLLTTDSMAVIRQVVPEVAFENWIQP